MLSELAQTLRERLAIIGDEESRRDLSSHLDRLKEVSEKITNLERQLPPTTDARLRHFLQSCSYDKALALLESRGS